MKKILLIMLMCSLLFAGCDDIDIIDGTDSDLQVSDTDGSQDSTNNSESIASVNDSYVRCDLNNDGIEDVIRVNAKAAAMNGAIDGFSVVIGSGKNEDIFWEAEMTMGSARRGGLYLLEGKQNYKSSLVYWYYTYPSDTQMIFHYQRFSFDADGKTVNVTGDGGNKKFELGQSAAIATQNVVFLTMREELNELLTESSENKVYVLLETSGDSLVYSTADNLVIPQAFDFELVDFKKQ